MAHGVTVVKTPSTRRPRVSMSDSVLSASGRKRSRTRSSALLLSEFRSTIELLRPQLLSSRNDSGDDGGIRPWYDDGTVEKGKRNAAAKNLASGLSKFLVSWEETIGDKGTATAGRGVAAEKRSTNHCYDFVDSNDAECRRLAKDALGILFCAHGPGNEHFRSAVLGTIPFLKSGSTFRLMLDAVPSCIDSPHLRRDGTAVVPKEDAEKNSGIGGVADEIIDVLRPLLVSNKSNVETLLVLSTLSRIMPSLANTSHRFEAFELCVEALAVVPRNDLPAALKEILKCVGTMNEGEKVVLAVREKWIQVKENFGHENGTKRALLLLGETIWTVLCAEGNGSALFRAGYLSALQHHLASPNADMSGTGVEMKNTEPILLDLLAILALQQHPEYKADIHSIFGRLMFEERFPLHVWQDLTQTLLAPDKQRKCGSTDQESVALDVSHRDNLAVALMQLVISAVLLPIRCRWRHQIDMFGLTSLVDSMALSVYNVLSNCQRNDFLGSLVTLGTSDLIHSATSLNEGSHFSLEHCPPPVPGTRRKRSRPCLSRSNHTDYSTLQLTQCQLLALSVLSSLGSMCGGPNELRRYGRVFVDRLLSSRQLHFEWRKSSGSDNSCGPFAATDITCGIVVSLLGNESTPGSLIAPELLALLQELLFMPPDLISSHCVGCYGQHGGCYFCWKGRTVRVVTGLLLSKHCLFSEKLQSMDREVVIRWVVRTILPPLRESSGDVEVDAGYEKRALDPTIGLYGLRVLLKLGSLSRSMQFPEDKGSAKRVATAVHLGDLYRQVKTMVARTGLVETLQNSSREQSNNTCLYQGKQDTFSHGSIKRRLLVFAISQYSRSLPGIASPHSATAALQFVFLLLDVYLTMGRQAATDRWQPDGWLRAAVILPSALPYQRDGKDVGDEGNGVTEPSNDTKCAIGSIGDEDSLAKLMGQLFGDGEIDTSFCASTAEVDDIAHAIMMLSKVRQRSHVDALIRHATGCAVAVGVCNAVVKNAHEHHLASSASRGGKSEMILGMIQHQLFKVYDLRRRIILCLDLLALIVDDNNDNPNVKFAFGKKKDLGRCVGSSLPSKVVTARKRRKCETEKTSITTCRGDENPSKETPLERDNREVVTNAASEGSMLSISDPSRGIFHQSSTGHAPSLQWTADFRESFSHIFNSPDFISVSVLWTCLLEAADDDSLYRFTAAQLSQTDPVSGLSVSHNRNCTRERQLGGSEANGNGLAEDAVRIISFKRTVAHHLTETLKTFRNNSPRSRFNCEDGQLLPYYPFCSSLSSSSSGVVLQVARTTQALAQSAEVLFALRNPLKRTRKKHAPLSEGKKSGIGLVTVDGTLFEYYDLLYNVLSHFAETCATETAVAVNTCPKMKTACESVGSQLSETDNAIHACQIMDILSVIPSAAQSEASLDHAVKLSWDLLFTAFTVNPDVASRCTLRIGHLPHSFMCTQRKLHTMASSHVEKDEKGPAALISIALSALSRIANDSSRVFQNCSVLRHSLLAHWGLLMNSRCGADAVCANLEILFEYLCAFLKDRAFEDKSKTAKELCRSTNRSSRLGGQNNGNKSRRTVQRQETESEVVPVIPGLTDASYPVFFELFLHLIIASFALSTPSVENGSKSPIKNISTAKEGRSPYKRIEDLAKLFVRTVDLFISKCAIFPKRMLPCFLKCSLLMIKACWHQVRSCVEWQSCQPLISSVEKKNGVVDVASVAFLQPIMDIIGDCTGKAFLLCNFARKEINGTASEPSAEAGNSYLGSCVSARDDKYVNGPTQKLVKNLTNRSEKLQEFLHAVSTSHNLSPPQLLPSSGPKGGTRQVASSRISRKCKSLCKDENSRRCVADRKSGLEMPHTFHADLDRRHEVRVVPENRETSTLRNEILARCSGQSCGDEFMTRAKNQDRHEVRVVPEKRGAPNLSNKGLARRSGQSCDDAYMSSEDSSEDEVSSDNSYGVVGDWCDDTGTVDASVHSLELGVHRA